MMIGQQCIYLLQYNICSFFFLLPPSRNDKSLNKTWNCCLVFGSNPALVSKSSNRSFLSTLWQTFCLPVTVTLSMTIPDCQTRRKWYPLTFTMSIVWISAVTYVLSWMLTISGTYANCHPIVHTNWVKMKKRKYMCTYI